MVKGGPEFAKRLPRFLRHEDIPTDTFTPRTYQVELLDAALQRNTLICLGSSSSKAFISLMVIKELSHKIRKAFSDGGKRTIYLVVSDLAAEVEWQILQHHTDLTVGKYSSDTDTEDWTQEQWLSELGDKQILVMVADVFRSALEDENFPVSSLNLVVFDDCHLAVEDHHYVHIMKHLSPCEDKTDGPQILGLTASVLGSRCNDPDQLRNTITSLEAMLHSRAETSMLVISERYGSRPKEVLYECESSEPLEVTLKLKAILESALLFLYEIQFTEEECGKKDPRQIPKNALSECHNILLRLGPWCASRIADMLVTQIDKSEKSETNPLPKRLLRFTSTQLRYLTKVFERAFTPDYVVEEFLEYTTPKVVQLVDILRKYKPDLDFMIISNEETDMSDESDMSDDSMDLSDSDEEEGSPGSRSHKQIHIAVKRSMEGCEEQPVTSIFGPDEKKLVGIVFVEQRYVAFALNKLIEEVCGWDENLCFIKGNHLTGLGWKAGKMKKDTRSFRKQEETLRKFRMQELNLLVSTSVLEEGVDVPKCNLVVRFDAPRDYRSYTLSKGRARARDAEYVILVERDRKDTFMDELQIFKGIEEVLIGDGRGRKDLAEEDDLDPSIVVDMLPPYSPSDNPLALKVTMQTAIALVNRYCAKLPSDAFTHLTPHCSVTPVEDSDPPHFIASLRLPVNSSIKEEITGVSMPSKKLAKMAVALKMCEMLHKAGELDENLMPVGKEMFVYEEEEEWEEEDVTGQARPGTTKRKQYYYKKAADAFVKSHVFAEKPCYLYFINLKLTGPITDEQNTRGRRIYAPEDTGQSLGILSSKEIPLVPCFPVYTRSGEVTVSVDMIQSNLILSKDKLTKLERFHQFVFTSVLHLEKDPMEFCKSSAEVGYLIVPLEKDVKADSGLGIQWEFVDLVESSAKPEKKNVFDKKRDIFEFRQEDFADAVVMPSYRNIDQPQHFYVAEIRFDLNPLSPFPSPELYKTFNEYYTTKYGLIITNPDQPLLDVDHTSARLNLLTPRYMNQKGVALPTSSAETKRARRENLQQKQILVPELCDIHVFPASLWRKAVCLPAVLYRMNYLLLAEEIRKRIAQETGIGVVELPEDFRFPQLDFGFETNPEKLRNESEEGPANEETDDRNSSSDKADSTTDGVNLCESSQNSKDAKIDTSPSQSDNSPSEISGEDSTCTELKSVEDKGEMSSDSDSGIASAGSEVSVADIGSHSKCDASASDIQSGSDIVTTSRKPSESSTVSIPSSIDGAEARPDTSSLEHSDSASKDNMCIGKKDENTISETNSMQIRTEANCHNSKTISSVDVRESETLAVSEEKDTQWCSTSCSNATVCRNAQTLENTTESDGESRTSASPVHDSVLKSSPSHCITSHSGGTNIIHDQIVESTERCSSLSHAHSSMEISDALQQDAKTDHQTSGTPTSPSSSITISADQCQSEPAVPPSGQTDSASHSSGQSEKDFACPEGKNQQISEMQHSIPSLSSDVSSEPPLQTDTDKHANQSLETSSQSTSCPLDMAETTDAIQQSTLLQSDLLSKSEKTTSVFHDEHSSNSPENTQLEVRSGWVEESPLLKVSEEGDLSERQQKGGTGCNNCDTMTPISCGNSEVGVTDADFGVWTNPGLRSAGIESDASSSSSDEVELEETSLRPNICLDEDRDLNTFVGPSPCLILQALTMSNANDFFSLERLETIGDSFLKYAITVYLYCSYPGIHEGKLSYLRSKQVSNYNLYRLGRKKRLAECMVSAKFEPYENWLPPGYVINENRRRGPVPKVIIANSGRKTTNSIARKLVETESLAAKSTEEDKLKTNNGKFEKAALCTRLNGVHKLNTTAEDTKRDKFPEKSSSDLNRESVRNDNEASLAEKKGQNCDGSMESVDSFSLESGEINSDELNVPMTNGKEENHSDQDGCSPRKMDSERLKFDQELEEIDLIQEADKIEDLTDVSQALVPYSLQTQHGIPDKSVADCVEALIGCYLTTCGKKAALMFMSWLGLKVLPRKDKVEGVRRKEGQQVSEYEFEELQCPPSPLLPSGHSRPDYMLEHLLDGYYVFEEKIGYTFRDRSYLLQAFTHASYHYNTITDCYQRLEFLGDAILDYVITRHLYEDSQKYSPGILTDLRSALVNNNIFAALAVKWDFHKYFKSISPALFHVIEKFVARQKDKEDEIDVEDEFQELEEEDDNDEAEEEVELEIPKALGDIFESVAGAIYLDSRMSLDTVWRVYYRIMRPQIEKYLKSIPKSPVRELLELEPETAKFEKPERTMDGKIRVTVNVVGKGVFSGIGRNYRIAKSAAAKKALRIIRSMQVGGLE